MSGVTIAAIAAAVTTALVTAAALRARHPKEPTGNLAPNGVQEGAMSGTRDKLEQDLRSRTWTQRSRGLQCPWTQAQSWVHFFWHHSYRVREQRIVMTSTSLSSARSRGEGNVWILKRHSRRFQCTGNRQGAQKFRRPTQVRTHQHPILIIKAPI